MTATGLIFSNIHDESIPELTQKRTMASVPFGCRYRLIDFPLSNMVNAGITQIGIITHYNYQSLLDHIGNGKDWDLARRSGGIKILPPFITAYAGNAAGKLYETRLEALMGVSHFIQKCGSDVIVLSDCDNICNVDLKAMMEAHEKSGADVTVGIRNTTAYFRTQHADTEFRRVRTDVNGQVTEIAGVAKEDREDADIPANLFVFNRRFLLEFLQNAQARGWNDFYPALSRYLLRAKVFGYRFDGYFAIVDSIASYFRCNMELLSFEARDTLFRNQLRPIFTKVRNSPPTTYREGAKVVNSLVADGCRIEGTVENCILFRGVKVGKGTVIKNCILMQDTYLGDHVNLNCVITDKNAVIRDGRVLSGDPSLPFFVGKSMML